MNIPVSLKIINRINPNLIWHLASFRSRNILDESSFILSFDCDTEEDISIAWEVHSRLQDMGITPTYAVPGELLKKGEKVYGKILESGAEFINHGGREHTYFDTHHQRHASCFFYDQQPLDVLKEDILQGHKTLQDVLGVIAKGWRTPHFGTFQNKHQLSFLYSILRGLNYTFSSSTCPIKIYQHGSFFKSEHIVEIPVTGIFKKPFDIMDTWCYFASPTPVKTSQYDKNAEDISMFAKQHPILINIYGDPSHIAHEPSFFQAMKVFSNNFKNMNFNQLMETYGEKIRNVW